MNKCCLSIFGYNCTKCCCKIPIKRFFLPFISIFALLIIPQARDYIYIPFIFFGGCIIIFWNFPYIIYSANSKPIYYEDLFIDQTKIPNYMIPEKIKNKFQNIFLWSLIITNSLLVSALSDYWFYKSNGFKFDNFMQTIGITGGVIKIFSIVNYYIGQILIEILNQFINKENKKYRTNIKKNFQKSLSKLNQSEIIIRNIISDSPVIGPIEEHTIEMIQLDSIMENKKNDIS